MITLEKLSKRVRLIESQFLTFLRYKTLNIFQTLQGIANIHAPLHGTGALGLCHEGGRRQTRQIFLRKIRLFHHSRAPLKIAAHLHVQILFFHHPYFLRFYTYTRDADCA